MEDKRISAVIVAAGSGNRMSTVIPKQFMLLGDKPIVYYSIKTFSEHPDISEVVLVIAEKHLNYCKEQILDRYDIADRVKLVCGGDERYKSVYEGIKASGGDYVFIHDGARPLVSTGLIDRCVEGVKKYAACVPALPVKDTIKRGELLSEAKDAPKIKETLKRSELYAIQTPQCFDRDIILEAYDGFSKADKEYEITDDASVVELFTKKKVRLIEGEYRNIKLTTPDDLLAARAFLQG